MTRLAERLNDLAIRQSKPDEHKVKILPDGNGLRLVIYPNGVKAWQFRTKRTGKETTLQIGAYPGVSLAMARKEAAALRETLRQGRDPITERRAARARKRIATETTFEAVAESLLSVKEKNVSPAYLEKLRGAFKANLYPRLGSIPIQDIDSPMLREALHRIEARGSLDMLANVRRWAGEVFDYAKANGQFKGDNPAHALVKNIFALHTREHMKALPWQAMPDFLYRLDLARGEGATITAVKLLLLTGVRPGEIRGARWEEIDLASTRWVIPASRMKARRPHHVPLSRQALIILKELQTLTGHSEYLFPARVGAKADTLSDMALLKAVRRAANDDTLTAHGFRASFRTHAEESGKWSFEVMEAALAHGKKNTVVGSYARATHYDARTKLMQWWADELDTMRALATHVRDVA
jgi:integrase